MENRQVATAAEQKWNTRSRVHNGYDGVEIYQSYVGGRFNEVRWFNLPNPQQFEHW